MRPILTLLTLLWSCAIWAQTTLDDLTRDLAASMQQVHGPKDTYSQSLFPNSTKPYQLTFQRITTNDKNKSEDEKWTFNLADIDPKLVRIEDSKEALRIYLRVQKGQKYIQYYKNGELSGYADQLVILGNGIDNAREVERKILAAIPSAVEAWNKVADIGGRSNEQLVHRLMALVGEVSIGNISYRQRLEQVGDFPDRLRLTTEASTSKGSDREVLVWSFGDLKESGVRLVISGTNAAVEANTNDGLAWVYVERDGVQDDFSKEVSIRVADPDQGKMVAAILEKLIPYGKEQIQMRMPQAKTAVDAYNLVAGSLGKIARKNADSEFSLDLGCQSKLTERINTQGNSSEVVYAFHFGDLDPKSVRLNMVKDRVEVSVSTEKKNLYVWSSKAGEQQNYGNEVVFQLADVEKGRQVAHLLPTMIEQCPEAHTLGTFADVQNWVSKGANSEAGEAQSLEYVSDREACKWKLIQSVTGDKKSSESTYEFNAYDLDPDQVKIIVSRKTVSVQLQTLKKENIISTLINEKPGYTSTIQLEAADVVSAKSLKISLEQLIKMCKQR